MVRGSALVMMQSDGIALVWPPVISDGTEVPSVIEDLLMRELCRRIDAGSIRLAQCLLSPDDDVESAVLTRHGFDRAADMYFLARPITQADLVPSTDRTDNRVTVESYRPENAERFERLVEETYRGSLDCPYLNGIRTGPEAIASHKLSGQFNAARWALYSVNGEDAGVLLLNDHPDQDAVELVYLGVAPHARGQGLGRQMLRGGLSESARLGQAVMFLAVDCENCFANSLYGEFEFTELARRHVMLRRGSGLARQ
jgi:ribosomal protein S18 acetylase RimI-like enzyme